MITTNLVAVLSKDGEARQIFQLLAYQHEPFGYTSDGLAFSKGKIDMAVLLDQERERYLAYECKRLNVSNGGSRQSLATGYVTQGIKRFVTEQYAEGLPVGCMLGYVLDGDTTFALDRVHAAIDANKTDVGLSGSPVTGTAMGNVERFSTQHVRPATSQEIQVRHALIPFPANGPAAAGKARRSKAR